MKKWAQERLPLVTMSTFIRPFVIEGVTFENRAVLQAYLEQLGIDAYTARECIVAVESGEPQLVGGKYLSMVGAVFHLGEGEPAHFPANSKSERLTFVPMEVPSGDIFRTTYDPSVIERLMSVERQKRGLVQFSVPGSKDDPPRLKWFHVHSIQGLWQVDADTRKGTVLLVGDPKGDIQHLDREIVAEDIDIVQWILRQNEWQTNDGFTSVAANEAGVPHRYSGLPAFDSDVQIPEQGEFLFISNMDEGYDLVNVSEVAFVEQLMPEEGDIDHAHMHLGVEDNANAKSRVHMKDGSVINAPAAASVLRQELGALGWEVDNEAAFQFVSNAMAKATKELDNARVRRNPGTFSAWLNQHTHFIPSTGPSGPPASRAAIVGDPADYMKAVCHTHRLALAPFQTV